MSDDPTTRPPRILIADDEKTFLDATADVLRDEGYRCDCACDAHEAAEKLRSNRYDLLISDIKMPGNPKLEFVRQVRSTARGMPVILVTGYPSVESAATAVELPVVAYVVKPLDFDELLPKIRFWVGRSQVYRVIGDTQQRLARWCDQLEQIENSLIHPVDKESGTPVDAFVELTVRSVAGALSDLSRLAKALAHSSPQRQSPDALAWAQLAGAQKAVKETIEVLEQTKGSFKSKQLGRLRHKLQVVVDDWEEGE